MSASTRKNIVSNDFNLKAMQSFIVMTDWEPDDAMFVVGFLREIAKTHSNKFPPVAFISGGANATIQNERAKKYVALCQAEGWLPKNAPIEFIKGSDSDQKYNKQGADVLTQNEINEIKKSHTTEKPEIEKIKLFLTRNPESMVFGLRRPDEMLGDSEILNMLSKSLLVAYAGGYNIRVDSKDDLKKFYNAFSATSFAQNFLMLQNGKEFPKGDGTPRDITKTNTPQFAKYLETSELPTAKAILENIRLWNEKILFEFATKAANSNPNSITEKEKAEKHAKGADMLKKILPGRIEDFNMQPETLSVILNAATLMDSSAKLADAKSDKDTLGFRKGVMEAIAKEPNHQVVIADTLALFAVLHPEMITKCISGDVNTTDFVEIVPKKEGKCLSLGPITGEPGKIEKGGTRILAVDNFLCETVLGIKPEPKKIDVSSISSSMGVTHFSKSKTTEEGLSIKTESPKPSV